MSAKDLPPDPFDPEGDAAPYGLVGDILAEGGMLLDALREARSRGRLLEAVFALDESDLRALVVERLLVEAFRDGLHGGGGWGV